MRWHPDEVDIWCQDWAVQRRLMLGLVELEPKDRLGKLRSTLAAVREDRDGASQGTVGQNFPEVYTGTSLLVHRAWVEMNREWKQVMNIHFVIKEVPVKKKAAELHIAVPQYWKHLAFAKNYVHSFVMVSTKYERPATGVMETRNFSLDVG